MDSVQLQNAIDPRTQGAETGKVSSEDPRDEANDVVNPTLGAQERDSLYSVGDYTHLGGLGQRLPPCVDVTQSGK